MGPLPWGSTTDQLFVLLLPAISFANTFEEDSVLLDLMHSWMASDVYSLSWAADDCSSVSSRTLNQPQLLLSGFASADGLGHPAGTVLGNPCPYCSFLVESLHNARKETLVFWPLFFRAVTSSMVPAEAAFQHEISGGFTAPLKFPLSGSKDPAGRRQR